jgi:putative FmdB family regulatory protein
MPSYEYECQTCKEYTTVVRKISEYDVPPEDGCVKCKSTDLKRVIRQWGPHQFIKPWGGTAQWHDESHSKTGRIRDK